MLSVKLLVLCVLAVGMVAVAGAEAARAANPVVAIETSLGTIKVELFEDKAPVTVKNFLDYVDAKHYDGLTFHRVIEGFMIQGGGMEPGGKERKTGPAIKNEAGNGLSNVRGTIAMARTPDPDSATSQFFINVADNTFLDRKEAADGVGYAVFGRVVEGMDVADKIVKVPKKDVKDPKREKPSAPVTDVVIKSVRRVEEKK
jgi:cyclophilin family peptidyl-prolyl cis-trans isomerase